MKQSPLVLIVFLLLSLSTQAQTSFPNDGIVRDGVYYNSFFGLAFTYPKDWVVPDAATKQRIQGLAEEEAVKKGKLAEMKDAYLLLTVSRLPLGTPSSTVNPTIMLAAEKISHVPGNPNAKDFLIGYRPVKRGMGVQSLLPEPLEFRVAGFQFFRDNYAGVVNGASIEQSTFVVFKKGYALVITFTAGDRKSVDEMTKSMSSILPIGRGGNRP